MSEQTGEVEQGSVNPAENLDRWITERTEKLQADAEPAPEPVAEPQAVEEVQTEVKPSWRDARLDDVEHGFLKGRTAGELYESYRHSELAKQKAEREAAEYRRDLDQIRQQAQPARPEPIPNPDNDPRLDRFNELLFVDPKAAVAELESRWKDQQREIFREETQRQQRETYQQNVQQTAMQASTSAMQKVMQDYGVPADVAFQRIQSTFAIIQPYEAQYGAEIWTNPDNYMRVVGDLFGPPPTVDVPAPTPAPELDIPNPPGSRRPAAAAAPSRTSNPISRELADVRRNIATAVGLDPDQFVADARRARG